MRPHFSCAVCKGTGNVVSPTKSGTLVRCSEEDCKAVPTRKMPPCGSHGPFVIGNWYPTAGGPWVKIVGAHGTGTDWETVVDNYGIHRFTRPKFGVGQVANALPMHKNNILAGARTLVNTGALEKAVAMINSAKQQLRTPGHKSSDVHVTLDRVARALTLMLETRTGTIAGFDVTGPKPSVLDGEHIDEL